MLVGDGIEPADHCGGCIGRASSTVASGDRLPQRMSGWRQLKVWGCVSDGARKRMELGQRSLLLWQLTKIRFANRTTGTDSLPSTPKGSAIRPTITMVCRVR